MAIDKSVIYRLPSWVEPVGQPRDAYKMAEFYIANENTAYTVRDLESETTVISDGGTDEQILNELVELGILDERMNHYFLDDRERAEFYVELIDDHGAGLFDTTPDDDFPEEEKNDEFSGSAGPIE